MEKTQANNIAPIVLPALDIATIKRLVSHHVDADISTPIAILPGDIERFDIVEGVETTDLRDFRAAYDALCKSKVSRSARQR
jgi:hypothetical protein